jgi:beta-galactosidase
MTRMNLSRYLRAVVVVFAVAAADATFAGRVETDLSGPGWKLWHDGDAKWEDDELFLPPVNVRKLPFNAPTGGWEALASGAREVSVPGTVEEYLHPGNGPAGDLKGVSWWTRRVRIPNSYTPRRYLLQFDAVRLRAEVFVNRKLVGYDVVGNTPFEVDITDAVKPGKEVELAVRVTDPGGNFDWRDSSPFFWGTNTIPMSHGFGGITGRVRLLEVDPVYVDDVYVQNTPVITNVNVFVTVKNTTGQTVRRDVTIVVLPKSYLDRKREALKSGGDSNYREPLTFEADLRDVNLKPGDNSVQFRVVPRGPIQLWDFDQPNLYVGHVWLHDEHDRHAHDDSVEQTFGFRWFAPEGVGSNAVFRLNGRRIVLRSAISWGFWPINGMFPSPEQSEREVRVAKALGQNLLNFHRCIGQPGPLAKADELGLLFHEEPGAYVNGDHSPFAKALAREKLLRMVRRDRSHPSLVIYNLINEAWKSGGADRDTNVLAGHIRDLRDAHALDPSRTITHTSAWATKPDADEPEKIHMRPFDDTVHWRGWFDNHHAGGPEVWRQNLYQSPDDYYNRTTNRAEIVFWGEEGAISSPPRLELIKAAIEAAPNRGWDGPAYLEWFRQTDDFLTRKKLRAAFLTVDAFTTALGAVSHHHQGRKIEQMRLDNTTDGYVVNGWEAELVENHSGIVDGFRFSKADPAIMAYYNQPLYVAVKSRSQFAQIPGEVAVDFYAINEKDLKGPHTLKVSVKSPASQETFSKEIPVTLTGGEVFGELLAANVQLPIFGVTGLFRIEARLIESAGNVAATGHDEVLAVDWRTEKPGGRGATWEGKPVVRDFLEKEKNMTVAAYRDDLGRLDWIVVTRPPNEGAAVEIPADRFEGELTATFFDDREFTNRIYGRSYRSLDYFVPDGAAPDQDSSMMENYGVRWEGRLLPAATGEYTLAIESSGGVRLWVDGKLLFDDFGRTNAINRARVALAAGTPAAVRVEFWHRKGNAQCKLLWSPPETGAPEPARLIERVKRDGTTLFLLDRADTWMKLIETNTAVKYNGSFKVGTAWLGGLHFVREHPLFKDLPVNGAMDWPYQAVVRNGKARSGLRLEGEEFVAGAWHSYPMELGTAVGVIPCGKGRIVVSTLDLAGQLNSADTSAHVARKLLCNFIAFDKLTRRP